MTDHATPKPGSLKFLFCFLHPGYMRYYYTTIEELVARGHRVDVVFDDPIKQGKDGLQDRLVEDHPDQVAIVPSVKRRDVWAQLARAMSWGMDFARYLTPAFREAHRLRLRVELNIHPKFRWLLLKMPGVRSAFGIRATIALLRRLYDAVPADPAMVEFIRSRQPDAVLVTPLITQGNPQCEYVKAAREARVPVAHAVASWDNLSSKGLIRGRPDRVILWNAKQRKEATGMHGIPGNQVEVTGAQLFDDWFARKPSSDRRTFLERAGMDPDRPFILYLCSSVFMAPNETQLVLRFVDRIRSHPALEHFGVLVRPYPEHVKQWEGADLERRANAVLWPPAGEYPLTEEARASFFDSIYHCDAVVGVNTSAMIESAILGKPVFTVLAGEFNNSQVNTIHFGYMRRENGGFLQVANDLDVLCDQLEATLADPEKEREIIRRFVEHFLRPHGLSEPCVPRVADRMVELADVAASGPPDRWYTGFARLALLPCRGVVNRISAGEKWRARRGLWKKAAREAEALGTDPLEHAARTYFKIDGFEQPAAQTSPAATLSSADVRALGDAVRDLRGGQGELLDRVERLEKLIEKLTRRPVHQR